MKQDFLPSTFLLIGLAVYALLFGNQLFLADYAQVLQDALYTLFGLLALNLLADAEKLNWKKMAGLSALLLLAFLSKESGVLYLVTCLVYAGVFKRRLFSRAFAAGLFSLAVYFYLRV